MALNGRPADRGQVDRPALDAEPLATEARQVQQIRDQSLQPVGLARPGQLGGHRVERPAQPGHLVLALHRYLHAGLAGGDLDQRAPRLPDRWVASLWRTSTTATPTVSAHEATAASAR